MISIEILALSHEICPWFISFIPLFRESFISVHWIVRLERTNHIVICNFKASTSVLNEVEILGEFGARATAFDAHGPPKKKRIVRLSPFSDYVVSTFFSVLAFSRSVGTFPCLFRIPLCSEGIFCTVQILLWWVSAWAGCHKSLPWLQESVLQSQWTSLGFQEPPRAKWKYC